MSQKFKVNINGQIKEYENKVRVLDLIEGDRHQYINALVNNHLRDLQYEIYYDCDVELFTQKDYLAIKIYETSLRYIIAMAASRALPGHKIKFSYNISRSIFISLLEENDRSFTSEECKKLKASIDQIIEADYPIVKMKVPNDEALKLYEQWGYDDKIEILKYRPEKTVHFCECDGYINYMYGHMVPSTGHIKDYTIRRFGKGIIIQYPRSEEKGKIPHFEDAPVFGRTLTSTYLWSKLVKADSIASINHHVEDNSIDFINLCEQHHNNMLTELGNQIKANSDNVRLICIAGPSSSGKTTFANRLRIELLSLGIKTLRISIDDYYLPKDEVPLDEEGKPDLECLEALDVELFNQNMLDLINGETVTLPKYSFQLGKRIPGREVKVGDNEIIIIEGIHALNEKLTSLIAKHQKFKIFIAPQAQINLDNHNPISLTDLRLLRRIVRDFQFRNSSAEDTMEMWPAVRKGEFKWIYKTQENADFVFNSLLSYELCVMKKYAMPLLKKIDFESSFFPLAQRLIRFLKYFVDLEDKWVPCNSILREFIGESCFQDV